MDGTGINTFSNKTELNGLVKLSNNLLNTIVGSNCMTLATSSSKNTIFGSDIMQSFNPSGADGGNIAFGRTVLQALTSGTFNVGIGLNALSGITNTSYNTGLGINAGQGVFGNYCTCIGTNSGQSGGSRLENSTSIGVGSQFTASNQVMLGTTSDTVVCPNALILAGTNILTTISNSISTGFTNFLKSSNLFVGNNDFVGVQRFAGETRGNEIVFNNGVMTTLGLTTGETSANTGVIQTIGGISANSQSFFNGIQMPSASYIKIGTNELNSTLLNNLSGLTSNIQSQINSINTYKSGQVIRSLKFYKNKGSLSNTPISTGNWTTIFSTTFNAKSNTSSFSCFFDCYWGVGGGGFDYFDSRITVYRNGLSYSAEPIIALKGISFNSDNRNNPFVLFPITGMMGNLVVNTYTVYIQARQNNSDDTLTINTNFPWCCDITEIQN